jgi:hypothetical protein
MSLASELYAAAARAGLLKTATIGTREVLVDFRAPDEEVLDGLSLSRDYTIRYLASDLMLDPGTLLVIDGVAYRVREARNIGDGSEARATLTRLS